MALLVATVADDELLLALKLVGGIWGKVLGFVLFLKRARGGWGFGW